MDDPDRGTLWPYWLGSGYAALLENWVPGQHYNGDLPQDMAERLLDRGHPHHPRRRGAAAPSLGVHG